MKIGNRISMEGRCPVQRKGPLRLFLTSGKGVGVLKLKIM